MLETVLPLAQSIKLESGDYGELVKALKKVQHLSTSTQNSDSILQSSGSHGFRQHTVFSQVSICERVPSAFPYQSLFCSSTCMNGQSALE